MLFIQDLIILDRDGVINEDRTLHVRNVQEWVPIPGSLEAIAALQQAGFTLVVATNQSGLARGYFSQETLSQIHTFCQEKLFALGGKKLPFYICPHGPSEHCLCRKPKPGLLQKIAIDLKIPSLKETPFIGDSFSDLEAAKTAGAKPILVCTGKGQETLKRCQEEYYEIEAVYADLYHFARAILGDF